MNSLLRLSSKSKMAWNWKFTTLEQKMDTIYAFNGVILKARRVPLSV